MGLEFFTHDRDGGEAVWFLDSLMLVKASGAQTGGAYALVEQRAPLGHATPYHVHRAEDETFFVLEGELEFISEGRRISRGPGGYVFLPRDIPHGFRVTGGPARYLVLTAPAGFEGFVQEAGSPATALGMPDPGPPDMDKLMAAAAKYRIEILGPLPE